MLGLKKVTMNPTKEVLENKLAELESMTGLSEYDIKLEFKKIRIQDNTEDPCDEWVYESMAFTFCENYQDKESGWGTYFGPMAVWNHGGQIKETPSIQLVKETTISYWDKRSKTTNNSLLKARYSGLVWNFSKKTIGRKPHYSFAVRCCESLLRIAEEKNYKYEIEGIQKLERAIFLACSLNNSQLIKKAKNTILNFEDLISVDNLPGLWGFSFDLLVMNKNVVLSDDEEKKIIDNLESSLQRLKNADPWVCEHAAERLARYYRSKGKDKESNRVIKILGENFENSSKKVAPLTASAWLEHLHQIYLQFNLSIDAERVIKTIRELGPKVLANMKKMSHTQQIPREKFDAYVDKLIEGDIEEVFKRIVIHYIPRKDKIENQLHDLAKKAPISFLFSKQISDHQGRVVAAIGPLKDDLDGHIVSQMSQNMEISAIFLSEVLEHVKSKFKLNSKRVIDYFFKSPIFIINQKKLLLKGLQAYFKADFITSAHIIPQIEATIRNLVEMTGGTILKRGHGGGFHLSTLDEIIRSEQMIHALGDEVTLYFRVVLTDQRGWNLRNDICHGVTPFEQFSKGIVDRLIHILLVLAQLRLKET